MKETTSNMSYIRTLLSWSLLITCLILNGCTGETSDTETAPVLYPETTVADPIVEGVVRIKMTEELASSLPQDGSKSLRSTGSSPLDDYLSRIRVKSLRRTFPDRGKYEERHRKHGLHLWYDVVYEDRSVTAATAAEELGAFAGVEYAETVRQIPFPNETATPVTDPGLLRTAEDASDRPFDDPLLPMQWHYRNEAKYIRHREGADINLYEAWKVETGKPNVVVAIVDGGVDLEHEDLRESIYWENKGWNFVQDNDTILPVEHGTHVAGTVAARNNNGIGVAGVAGGNGGEETGIRMMSCQVFEVDPVSGVTKPAPNFGDALVYAADNGAVIAQNSWGYGYPGPGSLEPSVQAAIDYFIECAGCDEEGNQLPDSPMKGGVVIFAAGNDGLDYLSYPAAYERVVAVAAMAPDFTRAEYTTRGDWVDITAPGGSDFFEEGGVLSTLPGDRYGRMQGTSMACPHVSGIAALIVSKYGGPGFTNEELKNRLLNSLLPQDIDSYNPSYAGKLGYGYIDAAAALAVDMGQAPDPVGEVETIPGLSEVTLIFEAVSDADDLSAATYNLYLSTDPIEDSIPDQQPSFTIPAHHYSAGDTIRYTVRDLEIAQTYYFALVATDRWGHSSDPCFFTSETDANHPPLLTPSTDLPLRIAVGETQECVVTIADPEGQDWTFSVTGEERGVTYERTEGGVLFRIRGMASAGRGEVTLRVTDHFFARAELVLPFEVYEDHPPLLSRIFSPIYMAAAVGESTMVDLSEYFTDEGSLTYTASTSDPDYLRLDVEGDHLTLTALGRVGNTIVRISAVDDRGSRTDAVASVRLVEDDFVYAVYPIPADKELTLVVSDKADEIEVQVRNIDGEVVLRKEVSLEGTGGRVQLDVSTLALGAYVLTVKCDNAYYETEFVKI